MKRFKTKKEIEEEYKGNFDTSKAKEGKYYIAISMEKALGEPFAYNCNEKVPIPRCKDTWFVEEWMLTDKPLLPIGTKVAVPITKLSQTNRDKTRVYYAGYDGNHILAFSEENAKKRQGDYYYADEILEAHERYIKEYPLISTEAIKLEEGKWYITSSSVLKFKSIDFEQRVSTSIGYFKASDTIYDTFNTHFCNKTDILRLATYEEIKETLIQISKHKKFVHNTRFIGLRDVSRSETVDSLSGRDSSTSYYAKDSQVGDSFYYNMNTDTLYTGGYGLHIIYENGNWAEFTKKIDDLLNEAKKKYPIGTKFLNARTNESLPNYKIEISEFEFFKHADNLSTDVAIIPKKGEGLVYWNGKWAEIVSSKYKVGDIVIVNSDKKSGAGKWKEQIVTLREMGYHTPRATGLIPDSRKQQFEIRPVDYGSAVVIEEEFIVDFASVKFKAGDEVYLFETTTDHWVIQDNIQVGEKYIIDHANFDGETIKLKDKTYGLLSKYFKLWSTKEQSIILLATDNIASMKTSYNIFKVGDKVCLDNTIYVERECEKAWIKEDKLEYNKVYEIRDISGTSIKLKNTTYHYWHPNKYFKLWDKVEPLSNFNGIKVGDYVTCQTWGNQAYKVAELTSASGFVIEFGSVGNKARQNYDSMSRKFEVISSSRGTIDDQDILNFEVNRPEANKIVTTNNLIITNQKQIKNGEQINGQIIVKKNRQVATIRIGSEFRKESISSSKRRATIVFVNPSDKAECF